MTYQFGCAIEGDGEVEAVKKLLFKLGAEFSSEQQLEPEIARIGADRIRDRDEVQRYLEDLRRRVGRDGSFLILFDGDKKGDCAVTVAASVAASVAATHSDLRVSVIVAVMEFEAWFLAARRSLIAAGYFAHDPCPGRPAESIRDAKGAVKKALGRRYRPSDQAKLVASMDLYEAMDESRSFRKLCSDFIALVRSSTIQTTAPKV